MQLEHEAITNPSNSQLDLEDFLRALAPVEDVSSGKQPGVREPAERLRRS